LRVSWVNYLEIGGLISILEGNNSAFLREVPLTRSGGALDVGDFGIFSGLAVEGSNSLTLKCFHVQIADIANILDGVLPAAVSDCCNEQLSPDFVVSQDLRLSRSNVRIAQRGFTGGECVGYGHCHLK
jgi:hypothetical protein